MTVYRDSRGVEYVSVPLPTHEVTGPVPLTARIASRRPAKKPLSLYTGTDGAELMSQPRGHRRYWTDEQWVAFEEHRKLETDRSHADEPVATGIIIKSAQPG